MSDQARYFMVGGFLGAGKTTAVSALAEHLTAAGLRAGLITNDQGSELVDTAMLRARGFATEEIPGGCFCCRFNSLLDAAKKLTESTRPDAFVAEPVGSCTDLIATVSYPLRRIYGERFSIAPLSVLVDPVRAQQILGLRPARNFSEKVRYIWRKQLEEADLIVITKADLLTPETGREIRAALAAEFPGKTILSVSVKNGEGVAEWFEILKRERSKSSPLAIDYDIYAEGEALLGWLNATVEVKAAQAIDSGALLKELAAGMQAELAESEIAHLKMTLSPDGSLAGEVAALSVVRNDIVAELTMSLEEPVHGGELIINCRAEANPDDLQRALETSLDATRITFPAATLQLVHIEQFRPGRPQPTPRFSE